MQALLSATVTRNWFSRLGDMFNLSCGAVACELFLLQSLQVVNSHPYIATISTSHSEELEHSWSKKESQLK